MELLERHSCLADLTRWWAEAERVGCADQALRKTRHDHARISGFPANRIVAVPTIIDPTKAR